MNALKENNEKNKDEKEKRTGIVTKESIGAVGVLFSALAFLILVTRGLIFGDIGEAIASFLLGVFGDCAYPLLLVAFYISLTSFTENGLSAAEKPWRSFRRPPFVCC